MACREPTDLAELCRARAVMDDVFARVSEGSWYERPIPERHRIVFYLGHVEAFDRNLIAGHRGWKPRRPELDKLFAFGIDPKVGSLPSDSAEDWPSLEEVRRYREATRGEVEDAWEGTPEQLRHVAVEHRLMHAETLTYLLHNLDARHLVAPAGFDEDAAAQDSALANERVRVGAGAAKLGRCLNDGFGWDNEFPCMTLEVPAFDLQRRKVSNGEYLEYMRATGANAPHFWVRAGGGQRGPEGGSEGGSEDGWMLRRMFGVSPLPLNWPVYVTHSEASAYARWAGGRLMTEAEWHRAVEGAPRDTGNYGARRWDPEPVTDGANTASDWGAEQLCGNGWEWTSSLFRPFPGFRAFPFYPGYSADFFDDDHYVLKGASPRTDAVFTRRSFRNWFRKDYPYVFATFRCAYDLR